MAIQVLGVVGTIVAMGQQFLVFLSGLATLKVACAVIFITATIALTAAMIASFVTALSIIVQTLPPEVTAFIAAFIPANMIVCATTVLSARTTRWVYDKNISTIKRICG